MLFRSYWQPGWKMRCSLKNGQACKICHIILCHNINLSVGNPAVSCEVCGLRSASAGAGHAPLALRTPRGIRQMSASQPPGSLQLLQMVTDTSSRRRQTTGMARRLVQGFPAFPCWEGGVWGTGPERGDSGFGVLSPKSVMRGTSRIAESEIGRAHV